VTRRRDKVNSLKANRNNLWGHVFNRVVDGIQNILPQCPEQQSESETESEVESEAAERCRSATII
jgi:hypothetical protein